MANDKRKYRQQVAFINREGELKDLKTFIDKEPSEILFLHGPKSSGKTTLLYRFLEHTQKEQKLDVKFLNLRKIFTDNYKDFLKVFFNVKDENETTRKLSSSIGAGFFKIDAEVEKKIREGKADPFKVMEEEFLALKKKGIKPLLIIDELQALDKVYMNNGKDRQLIIELFNFFVAMTKESHLAHIIIASSDGYFINTVYTDSKLKKASGFYKVGYLNQYDVMMWLLNLDKYSKITDFTLTEGDAQKIWDTVGGSMWEIQYLLSSLFEHPLDEVLEDHKKNTRATIDYYIGADPAKETALKLFLEKDAANLRDFIKAGIPAEDVDALLQDMVKHNILYFDPTEAMFYPQGVSYQWGIKLYFDGLS